jgi:phospholipid/cholesterol/gamma-HCH transport system substrate-binding protein
MPDPIDSEAPPIAHLELRVALLVALMGILLAASVAYLLYARGAFESTQELILIADDSQGIKVGMDLTFSGFPIGRVRRIELADNGDARIRVDVPRRDSHWLRDSSVFTLERGLLGSTIIRAFTGLPSDPPLAEGAVRHLLVGDATTEIPKLTAAARDLLQNLNAMTAPDSPLNVSLANLRDATGRLSGTHGMLTAAFGNERDAHKVVEALDRTNALLARIDSMAGKADDQVFGAQGLLPQTHEAVTQVGALLSDARESLKKVDALLVELQAVAGNAKTASADLGPLRAEVEASLRKVERLVDEVNRKWPFARDTELKLP